MAEIKKYLDTQALGTLVEQIKAEDAKVLQGAKDYADGLAKNYDAAGAAATAEANAKAYTDELANGQVKLNKEAIETLNGTGEGSVSKAVADAKSELQGLINGVDGKADTNAQAIAAINHETNGILAQAKADAKEKADAVQGNVDALAGKVGVVPEGSTVMGIITNIQENAYDDTELRGLITGLDTNKADKTQVATDISNAKTELEGKITTAQGTADAAKGTAEAAKAAIDAFLDENAVTEGAVDTLKEIQALLDAGEVNAATLLEEINKLKAVDNATQAELDAALEEVNGAIELKADKTVVEGIDGRVAALEAVDVATKAYVDQAELDAVATANGYADGLNTAMNARVEALESIDHEHENKDVIDGITAAKVEAWDGAVAKQHEHANKSVLDGITAEKVTAWDSSEQNAKTYADGLNTSMTTKVNGIDTRVGTLETTIVDKAEQDDLDAAVLKITANEQAIAANTSAINSFTPITPEEIVALFA